MTVRVGARRLAEDPNCVQGQNIGLVTNHSGMTREAGSTIDILNQQGRLRALFGPEHGVRGDVQAGQKVAGGVDRQTGVPVHSLYGETKRPTEEMLAGLDAIVFDLQDAGSRFYTYIYTLLYILQAAAAQGLPVYILDRPNPLGGVAVEGGILEAELQSFVGYPMPIRHGLTMGELGRFFVERENLQLALTIIAMDGWRADWLFPDTGLPWIPPSPNLASFEIALLYPGTCFFEGTTMSEGRGTTLPFQAIGAPDVDAPRWAAAMNDLCLPGVWFRAVSFTPAFSKYQGEHCTGIHIHVTDSPALQPVRVGLHLLSQARRFCPSFAWISPPPGRHHFIDLLTGSSKVRQMVAADDSPEPLWKDWQQQANQFADLRERWCLYHRPNVDPTTKRSEV